ncbi:MAG: hypothetical protein IPP17_28940 [Bacteroidetes bacterium]|nr:hypothetical protein [Bacteroidota bacterium]
MLAIIALLTNLNMLTNYNVGIVIDEKRIHSPRNIIDSWKNKVCEIPLMVDFDHRPTFIIGGDFVLGGKLP